MSIIICPSDNDEHAPFAHRLVVPISVISKHGETRVTMSPHVYVICAYCDHYAARPAGKCSCPVNCHHRMEEIRDQNVTEERRQRRKIG